MDITHYPHKDRDSWHIAPPNISIEINFYAIAAWCLDWNFGINACGGELTIACFVFRKWYGCNRFRLSSPTFNVELTLIT